LKATPTDPVGRFSSRAENYARYRPGYPAGVLATLSGECGLSPLSRVADVGSGTGSLSRLFIRDGIPVHAVEPNREMREICERLLGKHPGFRSVAGTAEATTLQDASVDFVVAGQSFHWFEPRAARREFMRILAPGGRVMLVWNQFSAGPGTFTRAYQAFLAQYRNHSGGKARDAAMAARLFRSGECRSRSFDNPQRLDYEGILGRTMSLSFIPEPSDGRHHAMRTELDRLFAAHARGGVVDLSYEATMYYGPLSAGRY